MKYSFKRLTQELPWIWIYFEVNRTSGAYYGVFSLIVTKWRWLKINSAVTFCPSWQGEHAQCGQPDRGSGQLAVRHHQPDERAPAEWPPVSPAGLRQVRERVSFIRLWRHKIPRHTNLWCALQFRSTVFLLAECSCHNATNAVAEFCHLHSW